MERAFPIGRRAALAGAASVGAASLAAPFVGAKGQGAEPMTLRVDVGPWGVHAALYLAQHRGWLRDAGLAVDLQDGTGTLSTINLVGAGRVDVGFVQLGPMAIGRASGVPVTSFAGFIRKGDLAVIVDRETGAKTPQELAGKKLTCFSASAWSPFIDTYLRSAGLRRGSGAGEVNVVMVTPPAMVTTYASGAADGFMSIQPYGEPLVATTRPGRSLLAVDSGLQFPSYGFIATDATIAGRADALRRLNATQVRAWSEMQADPAALEDAVQAILAGRPNAQLDPVALRSQARLSLDFLDTPNTVGKPNGWQSDADWKVAIASMADAGVVDAHVSPAEFYSNALLPG